MNRDKEVQVGIVFILAVAVLTVGVLWFKEFTIGGSKQHVEVQFYNTSGLQKGDPVEVRGVVSGEVAEINYHARFAEVVLDIDGEIDLEPGTRVVIENVGIMGQKMVAIYPGEQTTMELPDGVKFVGEYQVGMAGLMEDGSIALKTMNRLADRLERFLEKMDAGEEEQGSLGRIITNLDELTAQLATFMRDSEGSLQESVRNFSGAMESIDETLRQNGQEMSLALANTNRLAARADSTFTALESTLVRMDSLLAGLEAGEGTAGKMLRDEAVYEEMKTALQETRMLIQEIKANPRKFFKFSVF